MKLLFKIILFIFLSQQVFCKDFVGNYVVKTKGLTIGTFLWTISIKEKTYKTSMMLKNKGFISQFYKFSGNYGAEGLISKEGLFSEKYYQQWKTNKKSRDINIDFYNSKIYNLLINPLENELPRINYKKLKGYNDPLTSFLNIVLYDRQSFTVDGRRAYLLVPEKMKGFTRVLIDKYTNIWADHKRNDLSYLDIYKGEDSFLPKKINIKFKGGIYSLIKI